MKMIKIESIDKLEKTTLTLKICAGVLFILTFIMLFLSVISNDLCLLAAFGLVIVLYQTAILLETTSLKYIILTKVKK